MSACWKLEGLTSTQKFVLISLADQANDSGVCWPSIRSIISRTCLSERAVQTAIRELITLGLLRKEERINQSSVFTVTVSSYTPAGDAPPAPRAPVQQVQEGGQDVHPTPAGDAPHPRTTCTQNRNRTVNEPPKKQSTAFSVADVLLIFPGLNQQVAEDFIKHRKSKKAALTKTACEAIALEIQKSGWTPDEALRETMARGWQSFKADWVQSKVGQGDVIC